MYARPNANTFPTEVKKFIKMTLFPLYLRGTISVMLAQVRGKLNPKQKPCENLKKAKIYKLSAFQNPIEAIN